MSIGIAGLDEPTISIEIKKRLSVISWFEKDHQINIFLYFSKFDIRFYFLYLFLDRFDMNYLLSNKNLDFTLIVFLHITIELKETQLHITLRIIVDIQMIYSEIKTIQRIVKLGLVLPHILNIIVFLIFLRI